MFVKGATGVWGEPKLDWQAHPVDWLVIMSLSLNNMATILETTYWNAFFVKENFCILTRISLKAVIDNKSALVRIMAWGPTGDKPFPGPMLTQFPDAYMRHYVKMS